MEIFTAYVSLIEIIEYATIIIVAYYHPEYVDHFDSDMEILIDIIFAYSCVSIMCGLVLYYHLLEYDKQRKKLEEQNEKLKRYDESRLAFLTTVSHEVKNPLNAINLYAHDTSELLDEKPLDIAEIKHNQEVIENMVSRIDQILVDLKDTVAIEQGRLSLSLAPMKLDKLLVEASKIYFGKEHPRGNRISFMIEDNLEPIQADYARITQVVTNLISNSIKHTQNGIITITLKQLGDYQVVTVEDNGEGMKEEIRERVFKGYISDGKEYWRHGIGLYVCHQIIEAHNGNISIESTLGKGTIVKFSLPSKVVNNGQV